MVDKSNGYVHWSFWAIAVTGLIWNLMGVGAFFQELTAPSEEQKALLDSRPMWAHAAFAVAVFGGALGCVLLLLRKSSAFYLFVASLVGVAIQMIYNLGVAGSTEVYGPGEMAMIIMIPAFGAFLIWYAKRAEMNGWLT